MAQKPEIQYVRQSYIYGSEVAVRQNKLKLPKVHLPKLSQMPRRQIMIDPVALVGVITAVIMLAVLVVGAVQLYGSVQQYEAMSLRLDQIRHENAIAEHNYRMAFDMDVVRNTAESMGYISVDEVPVMTIRVTVPEHQSAPTMWENVKWFVKGLVA